MGFILKTGFWFGIVLLFLPVGKKTMSGTRQLAETSAQSLVDSAQSAARFCLDKPEVCEATARSTKLAGEYATLAAKKINEKAQKQELAEDQAE